MRVLSLLFTANAPQKDDVSDLLLPCLSKLLAVCKKHQKVKQERQSDLSEGGKSDNEKNRAQADEDATLRPPPCKRQRSEERKLSPETGESSSSNSKENEEKIEMTKERKNNLPCASKTKALGQLFKRANLDWMDTLAKIIESMMNKLPQ